MLRWRLSLVFLLTLIVGLPLTVPLVEVCRWPEAWTTWNEGARLLGLARNSFLLVAGVLTLVFPAGVATAFLLYRTDLPGRRLFRFLVVLTLFVPLPLFA